MVTNELGFVDATSFAEELVRLRPVLNSDKLDDSLVNGVFRVIAIRGVRRFLVRF